jgi:CopG family transcriptional regulator, nickel-responsive regulator
MQRITISLDDTLAREFDQLISERGYVNRSEAVRDLLRGELDRRRERSEPKAHCVATLSYIFKHHERDLAERLLTLQQDHHDLVVSAMRTHLDHDHCVETLILRGLAQPVRQLAERLIAERGVHHGHLNLVITEAGHRHRHGDGPLHKHEHPAH